MKDERKTKKQLIEELHDLRRQVIRLKKAKAENEQSPDILRETEEYYRLVGERSDDGVVIISGDERLFCNRKYMELAGWDRPEEIRDKPFLFTVHPDDREMVREYACRRQKREPAPSLYEYRIVRADGSCIWVEISSSAIVYQGKPATFGYVRDISERRRMETALRESEEKYRSIFENALMGIFQTTPEGRFITANRAMADMLGYGSPQELMDAVRDIPNQLYVHPAERSKIIQMIRERGFLSGYEVQFYRRDGSVIWVTVNMRSIHDREGGLLYYEGLNVDITERKRAEAALKTGEERYRSIIENIVDVYYRSDRNGRLIMVSPSGAELLGYDSERDMVGRNIADDFYHCAAERERLESVLREQGSVKDYEVVLRHRNGAPIPVSTSSRCYYNDQGEQEGIEGIFRDIRERKRAEEILRESENRYRALFEESIDGIFITSPEGRFVDVNRMGARLFGYDTKEEMLHLDLAADIYLNPEDRGRVLEILRERGSAEFEFKFKKKGGGTGLAHLSSTAVKNDGGEIVFYRSVIRDITNIRRAEEELETNRRQLESIIEFLPDATFVIDKEGRVISWNRAMEAMTGVKAEEMLGKGDHEYAVPFYGERRKILIDLAMHPDPEMEKQYTSIHRSGNVLFGESYTPRLEAGEIHLSGTASVLRDSRGEIVAAIECMRDNTERKMLEDRLQRAEKMEALGVLAGGVAHDLNNILGVMAGYSELMLIALREGDPLREHARNVMKSSERAAAIVQDMLTLARRGVVTKKTVNLNAIVNDQLRTPEHMKLASQLPRVRVTTDLAADVLNIKGSPVHLGKALMNLLANAAEAIRGEGSVTVRTRNEYLDRPVSGYDQVNAGDYVVLTVSDTGEGISPEDLKRIFEPFYTKKVMGRSGTGLGLSVVWGTVKDHDGYIDVRSRPGRETTFTLYFPVTREDVEEEVRFSLMNYVGRGESILVVDDVKEQRELATGMLTRLNYSVTAASSGEEALGYLKKHDADLIVLDMIMDPGIDGLETYRRIIGMKPGQKAVIVSGFAETDRVKQTQELGAGRFVRKPYILEKIGLAVRRELDDK